MIDLPTEADPVRVVLGDCADVFDLLPAGCVDAVITDPPYGVGLGIGNDRRGGSPKKRHGLAKYEYRKGADDYETFVTEVVPRLTRAIELAKRAAVFTGPHVWEQKKADAIGGIYCPSAVGRNAWGFKNLLPILFYGKAPELHKGAKEPTVHRTTRVAVPNGHPCPKPLSWMLWLVRLCTRPGDLVLDPFGGSGTTAVACVQEGRRCLVVEREPCYVEIARKRIKYAWGDTGS